MRGVNGTHSLLTAAFGRLNLSDDSVALSFYRGDLGVELELESLLLQDLLEALPVQRVSNFGL